MQRVVSTKLLKKILGYMMAFVFILLVLVPETNAKAAQHAEFIWVGNLQIRGDRSYRNNKLYYNADAKTLYLLGNNFNNTTVTSTVNGLTINVMADTSFYNSGLVLKGSTVITGKGKLYFTGKPSNGAAIMVTDSLLGIASIDVDINVQAGTGICGSDLKTIGYSNSRCFESLIVFNSNLHVKAQSEAMLFFEAICIDGLLVTPEDATVMDDSIYQTYKVSKTGNIYKEYAKEVRIVKDKIYVKRQPVSTIISPAGWTNYVEAIAIGKGKLTYQWQYCNTTSNVWRDCTEGSNFSGCNTTKMAIKANATTNGMRLRCVIKDRNGNSVTTTEALVKVR